MGDKIEDWFNEAKRDGVHADAAKWAFRLARARGIAVVADRALRALESIQHSVDYALINHPFDSQRQMIMQVAPHPEQFKKAQEDLAAATELVSAAELILEMCQRRPVTPIHSLGKPEEKKPGTRFGEGKK